MLKATSKFVLNCLNHLHLLGPTVPSYFLQETPDGHSYQDLTRPCPIHQVSTHACYHLELVKPEELNLRPKHTTSTYHLFDQVLTFVLNIPSYAAFGILFDAF